MLIKKRYNLNSIQLVVTCRRFGLDFNEIASIVKDYLTNGLVEQYVLKLGRACGVYEPFVKQEISTLVNEALEDRQFIGEVQQIVITEQFITFIYIEGNTENEN